MADISPTEEQSRAIFDILTWYEDIRSPFWRLGGLAGTGKTSLMKVLLMNDVFYRGNKQIAVMAFTHQAAHQLRLKGIPQAGTVHSHIYKAIELPDGTYLFERRSKDELKAMYSMFVVDEASMIAKEQRKDLESFGIPVLYVGDHGQLPPVSNDPEDRKGKFMSECESRLEEVHRQAKESPIIRLSMDIRAGKRIPLGKYGDGVWIADDIDIGLLLKTDQIIVGKNDTRRLFNRKVRKMQGFDPKSYPTIGERMVFLDNNIQLGVFNGLEFESLEDNNSMPLREGAQYPTNFMCKVPSLDGQSFREMRISPYFDNSMEFEDDGARRRFMKARGLITVDFAAAKTCHKMQGSAAKKPIIVEERFLPRDVHQRWMYTAVTRAVDKLIWWRYDN
jgi:exodeoxyribonuclease-5